MLEATVVCLDTSEWMRCGDYAPTRLRAQADAANLLCGARAQANPENAVGVLAMGGSPRVLATPTSDLGRVLAAVRRPAPVFGHGDEATSRGQGRRPILGTLSICRPRILPEPVPASRR